jgi:hypothetical protein
MLNVWFRKRSNEFSHKSIMINGKITKICVKKENKNLKIIDYNKEIERKNS